jgi:hypothetical protein
MIYLSSQILNEYKDISSFQLSESAKSSLLAILLKKGYKVLCNVPNQSVKEWVSSFEEYPEMILDITVKVSDISEVKVFIPFRFTAKEHLMATNITEIVDMNTQCLLFQPNSINLIIDITVKDPEEITGIINTIGKWLQL